MTEKLQNPWPTTRDELNRQLEAFEGGPKVLSLSANIDYFAARRLLKGGVKNQTEATKKLCICFGIANENPQEVQNEELQRLQQLVERVWDGTSAHAALLHKLISSTRAFTVGER